jgi:hypothetical protein
MRATRWARRATCALAISICAPAFADRANRSISSCTSFHQSDAGDAKVVFTIRNTCSIPVDCSLAWRVVCAPDSKKRRAVHPNQVKLALPTGSSQSAEASAVQCGDAGWMIDSVLWSCAINKD